MSDDDAADEGSEQVAEIRGTFRYRDGLTPGNRRDGGLSQNLYDAEGNLVRQGSFLPDDTDAVAETETSGAPYGRRRSRVERYDGDADYYGYRPPPSRSDEVLGTLLLLGVAGLVKVVSPLVKRWWYERRQVRVAVRGEEPLPSSADEGGRQTSSVELVALSKTAPGDFAAELTL